MVLVCFLASGVRVEFFFGKIIIIATSCRGDHLYNFKEMSFRVTDVLNIYSGDGHVTV